MNANLEKFMVNVERRGKLMKGRLGWNSVGGFCCVVVIDVCLDRR